MRITSKLVLFSVFAAFAFAFNALWVPPAAADSVGPTKGKAKYAQSKSHKAAKKAVRAKRLHSAKTRTAATQPSPTTVCYTCPQGATTYTWGTAATYGGGWPQPQAQGNVPQAQVTVPQTQTVQAPAPACYNPCVSCWNVPTYTWNAPATSGNAPQTTLQRILPPLPRPGTARSVAAQLPVNAPQVAAQPQAKTTQTTVCANVIPSWWPRWASLCH